LTDLLLAAGLIEPGTLEEVQHLLTRETVFDVMRREDGDFNFVAEAIQHDLPPEKLLGAEQILMDGLRMLDEWRTFAQVVPDEEAIFTRVGSLETARALSKAARISSTRVSVENKRVNRSSSITFTASHHLSPGPFSDPFSGRGPSRSNRSSNIDRNRSRRLRAAALRAKAREPPSTTR